MIGIEIIQNDGKRRRIGNFYNDISTFVTYRKKSKHLYRKLNAWGLDKKAFKGMVEKYDLKYIKIIEEEEGKIYLINRETFENEAYYLQFTPHRLQMFVPLEYFEIKER